MKRFIYITLLVILPLLSSAQVGIGTTTPVPVAALQIRSSSGTGLIIPMSDTSATNGILPLLEDDQYRIGRSNGLLIYDTIDYKFYYWNTQKWQSVNPFETDYVDDIITPSVQNSTISARFNGEVNGTINATGTNSFEGNGTIPVGGIIMWSGSTPPTGWALCDGNNGTPDLRGRFVVGFSDATSDVTLDPNYSTDQGGVVRHNPAANTGSYTQIGRNSGNETTLLNYRNLPNHTHGIIESASRYPLQRGQLQGTAISPVMGWQDGTATDANATTYLESSGITYNGPAIRSYTRGANAPTFDDACTIFEYTCYLAYDPEVVFQSSENPWSTGNDLSGYTVRSIEFQRQNVYAFYTGTTLVAYIDTDGSNITTETRFRYCATNSNYNSAGCEDPDHNPYIADGATTMVDHDWTPARIQNRPPYYTMAFIMRIR